MGDGEAKNWSEVGQFKVRHTSESRDHRDTGMFMEARFSETGDSDVG